MRCAICDYCEGEAKSLYNMSLIDPKGRKNRKVYYSRALNLEICNYCDELPVRQTKDFE